MTKFLNQELINTKDILSDNEVKDIEASEENGVEQQENEVDVKTVEDFIESLKWSYNATEDPDIRQKIGHQIIKIQIGLSNAGCLAKNIEVEEMPENVLGTFDPNTKKIALSGELLDDFGTSIELIKHVVRHELGHGEIWDEGMNEASLKLFDSLCFYVEEQRKVESTFKKMGVNKAISLYDIKKPEKLIDDYLEVELKGLHKDKPNKTRALQRPAKFDIELKKLTASIEKRIKDSIPCLYEKLETGYIREKIKEILSNIRDVVK